LVGMPEGGACPRPGAAPPPPLAAPPPTRLIAPGPPLGGGGILLFPLLAPAVAAFSVSAAPLPCSTTYGWCVFSVACVVHGRACKLHASAHVSSSSSCGHGHRHVEQGGKSPEPDCAVHTKGVSRVQRALGLTGTR